LAGVDLFGNKAASRKGSGLFPVQNWCPRYLHPLLGLGRRDAVAVGRMDGRGLGCYTALALILPLSAGHIYVWRSLSKDIRNNISWANSFQQYCCGADHPPARSWILAIDHEGTVPDAGQGHQDRGLSFGEVGEQSSW
jgi:hypothetical protein